MSFVYKYELTERGKIMVAGLIVLIMLILSGLLVVMAMANNSAPPANTPEQEEEILSTQTIAPTPTPTNTPTQTPTQTPTPSATPSPSEMPPPITDNPPPNGGGFAESSDSPTGDNGEPNEDIEPDDQDTPPPPVYGPIGGNPSDGTLSFLFSPDHQTELDDETKSLLEELLNSPKNTHNNTIVVETSQLSGDYSNMLMAAIVRAFATREIPEERIAHVTRPLETSDEVIEVSLYFVTTNEK